MLGYCQGSRPAPWYIINTYIQYYWLVVVVACLFFIQIEIFIRVSFDTDVVHRKGFIALGKNQITKILFSK